MSKHSFMPWIDALPEVGDKIRTTRDVLASKLAQADALEHQAASLRAEVKIGRETLIIHIMQQWTHLDLGAAAGAAGERQVNSLPLSCIQDDQLRAAIRSLEGLQSPLDALALFEQEVVRQHNLMSSATDAERMATLQRALNWWNFAVVPLMERLERQGGG